MPDTHSCHCQSVLFFFLLWSDIIFHKDGRLASTYLRCHNPNQLILNPLVPSFADLITYALTIFSKIFFTPISLCWHILWQYLSGFLFGTFFGSLKCLYSQVFRGLYLAPHIPGGLHWSPGDFPESTWSPGAFFLAGSTEC